MIAAHASGTRKGRKIATAVPTSDASAASWSQRCPRDGAGTVGPLSTGDTCTGLYSDPIGVPNALAWDMTFPAVSA